MNELLLKILNMSASEAAKRADENTKAFAEDKTVKYTESIRWEGFTYGKVEPVERPSGTNI
ncbi:hypothetical protein [Paraburkholderia caledonica]|uniref:hypothetical protein n=1 Tax=Paraburkholderia caledonica TaxID=134536 RepID=UPI000B404AC4|nr:hypothetical protein [Paraburkholderia caledonica]